MNWREIVVGQVDEDEEFGDPIDPIPYTLGELVDSMREMGSGPARRRWFAAREIGAGLGSVEWDGVIESIVSAIEADHDAGAVESRSDPELAVVDEATTTYVE